MQKNNLSVTLMKSRFGRLPAHCDTLRGLGLRRIRQTVTLKDSPEIQGMLKQVAYLVKVEQK